MPDDKYKTQMCRVYSTEGRCPYGRKCQFAHGESELRAEKRPRGDRTVPCRSFRTHGVCPYGVRCTFLHETAPEDTDRLDVFATLVSSFACLECDA